MTGRGRFAVGGAEGGARRGWWQRRGGSLGVLAGVLVLTLIASVVVGTKVLRALPEVNRDQLGDDRWEDPIGVERRGPFMFGHLPGCADGAINRMVLWDADSNPYWEVSGPATPMSNFVVGATPKGFKEVRAYEDPPSGEVLRLVVFRKAGGPAGIRFRRADLRQGRVVAGRQLNRFTVSGFRAAKLCEGSGTDARNDDAGTEDTTP